MPWRGNPGATCFDIGDIYTPFTEFLREDDPAVRGSGCVANTERAVVRELYGI